MRRVRSVAWEDPEAELISVRLKRIRSELETVRQLRVTTSVPVRPPAYDALQSADYGRCDSERNGAPDVYIRR